jgi:hypothetical protein
MRRYQQCFSDAIGRTFAMTEHDQLSGGAGHQGKSEGSSRRRGFRWGLYLPLILLALVVVAWSGFWLVARSLVSNGIDNAMDEARARGDVWTCTDRSISGYPFRIEVRCKDVTLTRNSTAGVVRLSSGPLVAIGQPHTPNHVIVQGAGPLNAQLADGRRIAVSWDLAEASRRTRSGTLERMSLDMRKPVVTLTRPDGTVATYVARQFEGHVRRNPTRPEADKAQDLFVRIAQMSAGDLDALLGDANPSDIDLQATTSQSDQLARGLTPTGLEGWRLAGGKLDLTRFSLKKGLKLIEATGSFGLDDARRLEGRIEPAVANIDQFAGIRLRGGAMDFASALSGRPQPASPDGARPLPVIDIRGGRVGFGPIRLPIPPLQPLY